ncbi:MAG: glycosyltransferase family 9 protein [Chloroflexota bacterium]
MQLHASRAQRIIAVGPEERVTLSYLSAVLAHRVPVFFELDVRSFLSMVANCDLFIACDSGPLHLDCALCVRAVAIFLQNNFARWGPPPELGKIVFDPKGVEPSRVLLACADELAYGFGENQLR